MDSGRGAIISNGFWSMGEDFRMDFDQRGRIFEWILIAGVGMSNGFISRGQDFRMDSSRGGRDFRMNLGRGAGFSGGFWSGDGAVLAAKFPSVVPRGG